METTIYHVFLFALLTAVCTWLGALPFLFKQQLSAQRIAKANALAASLMISASFGLIYQGIHLDPGIIDQAGFSLFGTSHVLSRETIWVLLGVLAGLGFILVCNRLLEKHGDVHVYHLSGADAKKVLLILGIMTLHSFTEGVAVWVSFGPSESFGVFISLALALHNIPEWLAISAVMVPRGVSWWKAGLWSIFSSIPQPIMAVPAFLFVEYFVPFLPFGLWFAAGAMLWMAIGELLPDALKDASPSSIATISTISIILMVVFQQLLS